MSHMAAVNRRGMTLLEVTLVGTLMLGILALAIPAFGGDATARDGEARASVSAALDAQMVVLDRSGGFSSNTAELDDLTPRVSSVVAPIASAAPDQVSVHTAGSVVSVAVSNGSGGCWYGRIEKGSSSSAGALYAVDDSAASCSGDNAASLSTDPDQPGRGRSPSEPIEL